jgi:hypothetical protein
LVWSTIVYTGTKTPYSESGLWLTEVTTGTDWTRHNEIRIESLGNSNINMRLVDVCSM